MDYKCSQVSCLSNVILCTRTKTKFSFPPLQRNTRFRKLTVQAYTVPFIRHLAFKLFCENNWGSWWMKKRNNQMFTYSTRSRMAMKKYSEIKRSGAQNEMKDLIVEEQHEKMTRSPSYHLLQERLSLLCPLNSMSSFLSLQVSNQRFVAHNWILFLSFGTFLHNSGSEFPFSTRRGVQV